MAKKVKSKLFVLKNYLFQGFDESSCGKHNLGVAA
jgi:hypothetical protein